MKLHELSPAPGSKRERRRVGRGIGSGLGKTSGKGHKGQKARTGGGVRPGFEGGQMPLHRRLPKRGFTNIFKQQYALVNVEDLNRFPDGSEVTPEILFAQRVTRPQPAGVKVLGGGELTKQLVVKAQGFSAAATQKIEAAGGKAEVI